MNLLLLGLNSAVRETIASIALSLIIAIGTLILLGGLGQSWHTTNAMPLTASSTYLVNSTADSPDQDQLDGVCLAVNGKCTLRAAIQQANYTAGLQTITLPSGVYLLTRKGFDSSAVAGDLDIADTVTIIGAGPNATIIDGNGSVTHDRVFEILPNIYLTTTFSNLTIRHGEAPTMTLPTLLGGGIYRDASWSGTQVLALNNVVLEYNSAEDGGGLYNDEGWVVLNNTTFRSNSATNRGGGLHVDNSALTIQDSQFYSNTAYTGGGLSLVNIYDGHIVRTAIYSNVVAGYGGALENSNTAANTSSRVTLIDGSLHNNRAAYNGGAIDTYASLIISRTTLDANSAGTYGGAIMVYQTYYPSTLAIDQSTLSHNYSQFGGGIYYNDFPGTGSLFAIVNSTLSDNTATHDGGAIYATGEAHFTLHNSTIAGNRVFRFVGFYPARGAGVFITATALITAQNTLMGDNVFDNGTSLTTPSDCFGLLLSLGYNLIKDTTHCLIGGWTVGNLSQDPQLGPLQLNGGSTQTRAPRSTSPLIDAGDPGGCFSNTLQLLSKDQRGWRRPIGTHCDIGAVEYSPFAIDLPLVRK